MEVHPVADLFPMLPDDELADLADSIREQGQLHAIVVDSAGRILDGRNRYAACQLAGVEPQFTSYEGNDPDGYALAVNIARRNLSKGQLAMVAARALFVTNSSQPDAAAKAGVSQARIGYAVTVLTFAPDLADRVVDGGVSLDFAYTEARKRKKATDTDAARMVKLQRNDPVLAERVTDGSLTLAEAFKVYEARVKQERDADLAQAERLAHDVFSGVTLRTPEIRADYVRTWHLYGHKVSGVTAPYVTPDDLRRNAAAYEALADLLEKGDTDAA